MPGNFCNISITEMKSVAEPELKLRASEDSRICSHPFSHKGGELSHQCKLWGRGPKIISSDSATFYLATLWVTEPVLIILCPTMSPCVGEVRKVKSVV